MKQTQLVLVGIGGYGEHYVRKLLGNDLPGVRIAAVVDPMAEKAPHWPELQRAGVPGFDSLPAVLAAGIAADLAVVSTPIALHAEHSCALLAAGVNVLCEKPMAATVADARRMQAVRDTAGKFLEIGYQWSFSPAIQSLKADILAGHFGVPRHFATWVSWPRTNVYYGRNGWAGCKYDPQGRPVFDSPANNATAHYLHNMLFLLGPTGPLSWRKPAKRRKYSFSAPIAWINTMIRYSASNSTMPSWILAKAAISLPGSRMDGKRATGIRMKITC